MIKTLKGLVPWFSWRHTIHNVIRGLVKQCIPQLQRALLPCWSEMKAQDHFSKGALCINCKARSVPVFFYKYPTLMLLSGSATDCPENLTAMPSNPAQNSVVIEVPVTTSLLVMQCQERRTKTLVQRRPWKGETGWSSSFVKGKVKWPHCTDPWNLISGAHARTCHRWKIRRFLADQQTSVDIWEKHNYCF